MDRRGGIHGDTQGMVVSNELGQYGAFMGRSHFVCAPAC